MTALILTAAVAAASFTIGLLYGDLRAVKQCNEILDANMKELFAAIREDRDNFPSDDAEDDSRPTVH